MTVTGSESKNKQNFIPNPVVVIKLEEGVAVQDAGAELRNKIEGKNLNVRHVTNGKDGSVIVPVKDDASIKLLEENVDKHLAGRFDVKVRESMKPAISDDYDENDLKRKLEQRELRMESVSRV